MDRALLEQFVGPRVRYGQTAECHLPKSTNRITSNYLNCLTKTIDLNKNIKLRNKLNEDKWKNIKYRYLQKSSTFEKRVEESVNKSLIKKPDPILTTHLDSSDSGCSSQSIDKEDVTISPKKKFNNYKASSIISSVTMLPKVSNQYRKQLISSSTSTFQSPSIKKSVNSIIMNKSMNNFNTINSDLKLKEFREIIHENIPLIDIPNFQTFKQLLELVKSSIIHQMPNALNYLRGTNESKIIKSTNIYSQSATNEIQYRIAGYMLLRGILTNDAIVKYQKYFLDVMKHLVKDMNKNFQEARSPLCNISCLTLALFARRCGNISSSFNFFIEVLFISLLPLTASNVKSIDQIAMFTAELIIEHTATTRILNAVLESLAQQKQKAARRIICRLLGVLLREWSMKHFSLLSKQSENIASTIKIGLNDADGKTREEARKVFAIYLPIFKDPAMKLLGELDGKKQKQLKENISINCSEIFQQVNRLRQQSLSSLSSSRYALDNSSNIMNSTIITTTTTTSNRHRNDNDSLNEKKSINGKSKRNDEDADNDDDDDDDDERNLNKRQRIVSSKRVTARTIKNACRLKKLEEKMQNEENYRMEFPDKHNIAEEMNKNEQILRWMNINHENVSTIPQSTNQLSTDRISNNSINSKLKHPLILNSRSTTLSSVGFSQSKRHFNKYDELRSSQKSFKQNNSGEIELIRLRLLLDNSESSGKQIVNICLKYITKKDSVETLIQLLEGYSKSNNLEKIEEQLIEWINGEENENYLLNYLRLLSSLIEHRLLPTKELTNHYVKLLEVLKDWWITSRLATIRKTIVFIIVDLMLSSEKNREKCEKVLAPLSRAQEKLLELYMNKRKTNEK
ncbi:hypothetical protein SNEBB_001284 [Seison nebaliae]|nr:hypothetical protein SNEBB_001284 [Seison nebaliae]